MNDNNLNDTSLNTKYRATKNLNTALEKPEFNVNDSLDINIKDVDNNNFAKNNDNNASSVSYYSDLDINKFKEDNVISSTSFNETNSYINNNGFIDNNISDNINNNSFIDNNIKDDSFSDASNVDLIGGTNNKSNYKPAMEESKKKNSIELTTELKILIFMASLIMIFIFMMPYISDIFNRIKLVILYR